MNGRVPEGAYEAGNAVPSWMKKLVKEVAEIKPRSRQVADMFPGGGGGLTGIKPQHLSAFITLIKESRKSLRGEIA